MSNNMFKLNNIYAVKKGGDSNSFQKGEKHIKWKGDAVGYRALHTWIRKYKGKAAEFKCIDCSKQAEEWSNFDHSWKRVLEDYDSRCRKCHKRYDKEVLHIKFGRPKIIN